MGGRTSAASINKYIAKAYDRINLTVPKGDKEDIQAFATAHGESVNGFIGRAIAQAMQPDTGGGPVAAPAGSVPPDKVEAVKAHLEKIHQSTDDFLARAIDEQVKRDEMSLRMEILPIKPDERDTPATEKE